MTGRPRGEALSGTACRGIPDNHAVAVEAPAQELIGGTPEVQAEAAIVEVAKTLDNEALAASTLSPWNRRKPGGVTGTDAESPIGVPVAASEAATRIKEVLATS